LPDEVIGEMAAYLNRYGHVSEGPGPRDGEDEEPEHRE
jgi:hypothetical protein